MASRQKKPILYYSPPLRIVAQGGAEWTFETLVVGADGEAQRLPGVVRFPEAEGRKACSAHVLAQMRVDRAAAKQRGGAVGLVAIVDLASWEDLCMAYDVVTVLKETP